MARVIARGADEAWRLARVIARGPDEVWQGLLQRVMIKHGKAYCKGSE